jgi:hypothetical protein
VSAPMYSVGFAKYGMHDSAPPNRDRIAANNAAVTTTDSHVTGINPENPFVWLVGIGALTLGLVAFSTHVRVGNVRAGLDAGTP